LLGCVLSVKNNDGGWWGEGDEIVYMDGRHVMRELLLQRRLLVSDRTPRAFPQIAQPGRNHCRRSAIKMRELYTKPPSSVSND
jgi:hypothetical protein